MNYVHRCLIVPTEYADAARQLAALAAGPAGEGMFIVPLSPTGTGDPSHYISVGPVGEDMAVLLESGDNVYAAIDAATEGNSPYTLEQCQALIGACDISEDAAQVALARLGLQVVQDDDPLA